MHYTVVDIGYGIALAKKSSLNPNYEESRPDYRTYDAVMARKTNKYFPDEGGLCFFVASRQVPSLPNG